MFVAATVAHDAKIILILAAFKSNVDVVCYIPIPKRDFSSKLKLMAICTFDVNMPDDDVENFKSGVTCDSILEGMLRVGDKIEVRLIVSVRSRTLIFLIRDPILFPSYIHSQKRLPASHLKDANMVRDFFSLRPESLHMQAWLF
ncbi:hypothetical protein DD238_003841 [Peronospora effusa]|uniref:Catalase core domain-containing protein n=1 Tax=Peronospora effusa TaxID=542832 RepID=A0A3M6VM53_9STRA|nr:hypothetical protein DD238_003841 [Peronospora effusa]